MALALPFVGAGIGGLHRLQHLFGLHAEEDAVDRLELEGVVVIIHHFHQSIAGGQIGPLVLRRDLLQVLIAQMCIRDSKMRCEKSKLTTVKALQSIGYDTIASGDSFNDLGMIQALSLIHISRLRRPDPGHGGDGAQ